jgi:hypothetical protein
LESLVFVALRLQFAELTLQPIDFGLIRLHPTRARKDPAGSIDNSLTHLRPFPSQLTCLGLKAFPAVQAGLV